MIEVKFFNEELQKKLQIIPEDLEGFTYSFPYATENSAAFDLRAIIEKTLTIFPGSVVEIPTGIGISAKYGDFQLGIRVFIRSGVSSHINLANGVGLIDPDYQGEIKLKIHNHSNDIYQIFPGERIAQAEFFVVFQQKFAKVVPEFTERTIRAENGFGHTGKY